jgi:hypothetical protein
MLHVATAFWDANEASQDFSRCYNETWVEKLHAGFRRNLTIPFRFVVWTDRRRHFSRGIDQMWLTTKPPNYTSMIEPFCLSRPMILVGLDTLIVGNIDHLARHCLDAVKIALPRDPYQPDRSINGVALVPPGWHRVWDDWSDEDRKTQSDMDRLRDFDTDFIDDRWPGHVVSMKANDVRRKGLQDARIVYFHGYPKMHEMAEHVFVRDHWRI